MENNPATELRTLFWEATLRCNAYCSFCGSCCGDYSAELLQQSEPNAETVCHCFEEIAHTYTSETIMINVTGGEPLLRRDLFDIMTFASNLGFPWGMVTNGSLIQTEIVEKMKTSGMKTISISLDGLPDTHNKLRKIPHGFEKIQNAVALLKKADFLDEIQITTVVNHENIHELEALYAILQGWHIDSWRLAIIDPIGRAQERKELLLTEDDYLRYFSFLENHQFDGKMLLMTSCSHYLGAYDNLYRNDSFFCGSGRHVGSILANGDIYVCPNVPRIPELIQGNIKKDSFSDVWEKGFQWFRNEERQKGQKCQKCKHYKNCKGDSLHTWDFTRNEPWFCYREHAFGSLNRGSDCEDDLRDRLLSYYPQMKGIRISYGNSSEARLIFTPAAAKQLLAYFEWGERTPRNCFELLVGLAGFKTENLIVVEHIIPGSLENRSKTTAEFSVRNYDYLLRELSVLNQGRKLCHDQFKLSDAYSLVGIAHSHPLDLSAVLSLPDIELHGRMQFEYGNFISLILNPQKMQIAAYYNSVFTPIDMELLMGNESNSDNFND